MTIAFLIALAVAVIVFFVAFRILWSLWMTDDDSPFNDPPGPLPAFLPFATGVEAFESLWLVWAFIIGLLVVWALWRSLCRWFPRTTYWFERLLPLPRERKTYGERPRWEDASPRPKVTDGPTMLQLVKGLKPGAPTKGDGGQR